METDGAVRASTGGPDYGESQFNRATHAKRQPGSSFKVYVYATALENGYKPTTMVRDASRSCGNWYAVELRRRRRRRRTHAAVDGARQVAQHGRRRAVVRGRAREGHRDDAAARHQRHPQDLLDGARRLRHHAARARRRRRDVRQRRQARQALRHPRSRQLQGRSRLQPRARRAARRRRSSSARSPSR